MVAIRNHIPGLIKPISQPAMFVGVHKDSIKQHPTNNNMIRIKVIKGWRRNMKKAMMRFFEDYDIPKSWLYAYPDGINNAMIASDNTKFICGIRNHCHKDLMQDYQRKLNEIHKITVEKFELEKTVVALERTIGELRIQLRKTQK